MNEPRDDSRALRHAFFLSVASLFVLALAVLAAGADARQEQFESIRAVRAYAADLASAGERLRLVLALDSVFLVLYAGAIGSTLLGFGARHRAAAWLSGGLLVALALFDAWENHTMVQSLDLVVAHEPLTIERITHQVGISSFKWNLAALLLFFVSFLLPDERLVERLLVWGTRLGLLVSVPLFVFDPSGLGGLGGTLIYATMLSGFVLLPWVTWEHAARSPR